MKLRYTGTEPTSFTALRLWVEPEEEFEVTDEDSIGLLLRSDVERVADPPRASKAKADKPGKPTDEGPQAPNEMTN